MADANMRMVEANSWPFVDFSTHNVGETGTGKVRLVLTNDGVGPRASKRSNYGGGGSPLLRPLNC